MLLESYSVFYLKKGCGETFQSYYQSPTSLVSEMMKQVMSMYEARISFRPVYLIDREKKCSYNYYIPLIPKLSALSAYTERLLDGREKQPVLDREKVEGHHIFYLSDSTVRRPVFSLAAVESLLRRNAVGLIFQEVEVR